MLDIPVEEQMNIVLNFIALWNKWFNYSFFFLNWNSSYCCHLRHGRVVTQTFFSVAQL